MKVLPIPPVLFRGFHGLPALLLLLWISSGLAQDAAPNSPPTVETAWPGIHYEIPRILRIKDDRILVLVRIRADAKAPPTSLATRIPIPAGVTMGTDAGRTALFSGRYNPQPFSIADTVMIDEVSQIKYATLPPVAPPGKEYYPSLTAATLRPGQAQMLSIQFPVPPPPPARVGQPPVNQMLSFLLPKAKGPVLHVPLPPSP